MTFSNGITVHRVARVEATQLMTVELIVASGRLERVLDNREALAWEERTISVVSRRALVAMKRLAGRPQDRADLVALGEAEG